MQHALIAAAVALGLALPAAAVPAATVPAATDYWSEFEAGVEAYAAGRHAEAAGRFRPLAEAGDDRAQYWLGIMYFEGKGVPQDDVRAYLWLGLAADQDNRAARLGRDSVARRMSAERRAQAERLLAARRRGD